jgi:hypothetical protein
MRVVGVADIKPEIAEQAATYLASVFGPDSETPASPTQVPEYKSVRQDHENWSDDALNIMYVDYQLTGEPKDRPGTGRPDKNGFIWLEMGGGLAKLNPETGEVKVFRLDDPSRPSIHEVFPTVDGSSVWLTIQDQNALVRFDTHTEKFDPLYKDGLSSEITMSRPSAAGQEPIRRLPIQLEISGLPAGRSKNSISRPKNIPTSRMFPIRMELPWTKKETFGQENLRPGITANWLKWTPRQTK